MGDHWGKTPAESGKLIHWLTKDEKRNKATAHSRETQGALKAELSYSVLASRGGRFLLEVRPVTGRPHQIRVQLSAMGCPIAGDVKYGAPTALGDGSVALHARRLSFEHPVKKEPLMVEAPLPDTGIWGSFSDYT